MTIDPSAFRSLQKTKSKSSSPVHDSVGDSVVQSVYDHLLTSITIDVACGMHRIVKTGDSAVPYTDLMIPRERRHVYPNVSDNTDSKAVLKFIPNANEEDDNELSPSRKKLRSSLSSSANKNSVHSAKDNAQDSEVGIQTRNSQADIWGRIPPKEPSQGTQCSVCGRHVTTLRFTPHLDKCMGISTSSRSGAGGNSSNGGTRSGNTIK